MWKILKQNSKQLNQKKNKDGQGYNWKPKIVFN